MTRRVYVLLVFDPATAVATRPVGVIGVEGDRHHISWVPLEPAADVWRERLHPTSTAATVDARVAYWVEHANGVTLDIAEMEAPHAADLAGAVEVAVDQLLAVVSTSAQGS